jgi:hypothetical protein
MIRSLALCCLLASGLAACEGAEAKPAPATAQKASASTAATDHDLCVAIMTHARTCTDQFIPALVDARAAVDVPAGIKAEVAKDRDSVIGQAKTEWASDSSDVNIEKMCAQPIPDADARRDAATACQAKTDCGEFAACFIPIESKSLRP